MNDYFIHLILLKSDLPYYNFIEKKYSFTQIQVHYHFHASLLYYSILSFLFKIFKSELL